MRLVHFFIFRWSADKVLGPQNVYPIYADNSEAWTASVYDANQFIQVGFTLSLVTHRMLVTMDMRI